MFFRREACAQGFGRGVHDLVGDGGAHLGEHGTALVFGGKARLFHNLGRLTPRLFHNALLQGFGLGAAFGQNGLPLRIEVGDARFHLGQLGLGLRTALLKTVQRILDALPAVFEIALGHPAHKVPEDTRKDHEVEHTPAEVAPARRRVAFTGAGCLGQQHQRRSDAEKRQDKPRVFPFAQSPPPRSNS